MSHRVAIVVFEGMTLLDVTGPAEVFRLANQLAPTYELIVTSPHGGPVRSSSGLTLDGSIAADDVGRVDTLIVAGADEHFGSLFSADLLDAVATLADDAGRVASVCTGTFVLAELGFLDGRRATTHWRHANELALKYPKIAVEPDVIFIQDGRYMSSAGIAAGIDLAFGMVEDDLGADKARAVARELVMFMQRPGGQSQFSTALHRPPAQSGALREMMESVIAEPAEPHTLTSMSACAGVSPRHLNRLFQSEVGTTPIRWLEEVRVDVAKALVLEGHSITRAAQFSGLGSDETLRRVFAKHLGTTPTAFRERFATTHRN